MQKIQKLVRSTLVEVEAELQNITAIRDAGINGRSSSRTYNVGKGE